MVHLGWSGSLVSLAGPIGLIVLSLGVGDGLHDVLLYDLEVGTEVLLVSSLGIGRLLEFVVVLRDLLQRWLDAKICRDL